MFKFALGSNPSLNIDFRCLPQRELSSPEQLRTESSGYASRQARQAYRLSIDSISIPYTTNPELAMPVVADYKVTTASQALRSTAAEAFD